MKSLGATRPGAVARTQIDVAAAQRVANHLPWRPNSSTAR